MAPLLNREEIEQTKSLAEAVRTLFDLGLEGRLCIFADESMEGEVARTYNELGLITRKETYRRVAEDFMIRVDYVHNLLKNILDVGCGSGLLSLELAGRSVGAIVGIDLSADMIALAHDNTEKLFLEGKKNLNFIQRSVYELDRLTKESFDYIVCRNTIHRFKNPQLAIQKMYDALSENGQIYLRDLRRDAAWPIVVKRIGEERWKYPALVRDYIGAMAQMLTTKELEELLMSIGIHNFEITEGSYVSKEKTTRPQLMNEYASKVEYVCVIQKQ